MGAGGCVAGIYIYTVVVIFELGALVELELSIDQTVLALNAWLNRRGKIRKDIFSCLLLPLLTVDISIILEPGNDFRSAVHQP